MKVKRYKHAKRVLLFYKHSFAFREPYQVIGKSPLNAHDPLRTRHAVRQRLVHPSCYLCCDFYICRTNYLLEARTCINLAAYSHVQYPHSGIAQWQSRYSSSLNSAKYFASGCYFQDKPFNGSPRTSVLLSPATQHHPVVLHSQP